MTSSRLPGKVMMMLGTDPLLKFMISRVKKIKLIDRIIVATTKNKNDLPIIKLCKELGIDYYRGDEFDVLGRYYQAASTYDLEHILRLTSDCPMIDPEVVDQIIIDYFSNPCDYSSNTVKRTFPDGFDAEVFGRNILIDTNLKAKNRELREHVTLYMNGKKPWLGKGNYKITQYENPVDYSFIRLTVDTIEDLKCMNKLIKILPDDFLFNDLISLYKDRPELFISMKN